MKRVLVLDSFPVALRSARGAVIKALIDHGHMVHAAAPALSRDRPTSDWLTVRGVVCHDLPVARTSLNPLGDMRTMLGVASLLRLIGANVFLGCSAKPVIWGLLAAALVGVPSRVALITGLGYAFTGRATGKRAAVQKIVRLLYSLALRRATLVFFQNRDDLRELLRQRIMPTGVKTVIVNGSGVDTAKFIPTPFPKGPLHFLLIARLLGDKGIREYANAAAALKKRYPEIHFHLVGGIDDNPDSLAESEVHAWQKAGHITWHGVLSDVRSAIASTHVYVLPSYREGTPRTVLEAMAMGRPIVTTDAPGCRETVLEGVNGFLVPVRNGRALEKAMQRFVVDPSLLEPMGARSREIAFQKYDAEKVKDSIMKAAAW